MEWASVRAWMVIREPFITVSVVNCEGRRKKRGGGMKREGSVRRKRSREEREGEKRGKAREEGLGSSQGEGRTNVLCGGLHPWRSRGHPLVIVIGIVACRTSDNRDHPSVNPFTQHSKERTKKIKRVRTLLTSTHANVPARLVLEISAWQQVYSLSLSSNHMLK